MAEAARQRVAHDPVLVPALWWFEVRNVLIVNERRGRLDASKTARALSLLNALPLDVDSEPDEERVLLLARRHRLNVYGAAYLALVLRDGLPLATLDDALARASVAEGVKLVGER
ncbi:MAG TPA: type II toxin-antitoxin system VapC family toxin [Rhizobiaceae bacterium]|nr:type II toxin-antitoxin system VapC family toxin [Rhizobiaceae bacterium]